jgi:hypothetical protein
MEKKNRKQEESAKKAMAKCGDTALKSGISPGAVVTLQVDYRKCYNPEGLVVIVFDVQPRTGGVRVCCQHGVITHDGGKVTIGCLQINMSSRLQLVHVCPSQAM